MRALFSILFSVVVFGVAAQNNWSEQLYLSVRPVHAVSVDTTGGAFVLPDLFHEESLVETQFGLNSDSLAVDSLYIHLYVSDSLLSTKTYSSYQMEEHRVDTLQSKSGFPSYLFNLGVSEYGDSLKYSLQVLKNDGQMTPMKYSNE